jgi:hypothetical protein
MSLEFLESMTKEKGNLYMVGLWETQGGRVWVLAENAEQAKADVEQALELYGIDDLAQDWKFDPTHRETQVFEVELVGRMLRLKGEEPSK